MKCSFCDRDEKDVKYMFTHTVNQIGICDSCILNLSKKLTEILNKEQKDLMNNIANKNRKEV